MDNTPRILSNGGPRDSLRVLVAGMGNVLRRDDGFGIAVARRLLARPDLPEKVAVIEAGTAGVRVVQELLDGYDGLILVDAVERGGRPGTLYELAPRTGSDAIDSLHTVDPSRILALARAAGCLPARTLVVGCEPADYDELSAALSPAAEPAVERAVALIVQRIADWSATQSGVDGVASGGVE